MLLKVSRCQVLGTHLRPVAEYRFETGPRYTHGICCWHNRVGNVPLQQTTTQSAAAEADTRQQDTAAEVEDLSD